MIIYNIVIIKILFISIIKIWIINLQWILYRLNIFNYKIIMKFIIKSNTEWILEQVLLMFYKLYLIKFSCNISNRDLVNLDLIK